MLTRQRQQLILQRLRDHGQVVAADLSRELAVSEDTIRRDLRELARTGALQRVHGGALPASPALADLQVRAGRPVADKAALGAAAAALIEPGQVVLVDGGTTTVQLVRALPPTLVATVITHSPVIAAELIAHPGVEVVMIGGRLFKHSGVAVGAAALEAIRGLHADLYVMGVTGVHPEHGLTTGDYEEAHVKRALVAAAGETVLLADDDKIGRVSPYTIAPARAVSTLVVPAGLAPDRLQPYADLGLTIVTASTSDR